MSDIQSVKIINVGLTMGLGLIFCMLIVPQAIQNVQYIMLYVQCV